MNLIDNQCSIIMMNYIKNKKESLMVAFVAVAMFFLMGNYFTNTIFNHHLDTAFLLEITDGTIKNGEPLSKLLNVAIKGSETWNDTPENVCTSNLLASNNVYNALDNHAYYAIYPISLISNLFSESITLSYLNSLSFLLLLIIPYLFLRNAQLPVLYAMFFSLIVSMHFAWSYSSVGDLYLDRFYMPFALLYMAGLYSVLVNKRKFNNKISILLILLSGIVAASMTERAAIMIGLSTFSILFISWEKIDSQRIRLALGILGSLFLVYAYWYISSRFIGVETGGSLTDIPSKLNGLLDRLFNQNNLGNLIIFTTVNVFMLGMYSVFAGFRTTLVAVSALLPNLLVTVGGAELVGWTTHYHTMYFPALIFTSMLGYSVMAKNDYKYKMIKFKYILMLVPIFTFSVINPYSSGLGFPSTNNYLASLHNKLWTYYVVPSASIEATYNINNERFNRAIPEGANISVPEAMMPILYKNRNISYYPLGIDTADYTILNLTYDESGSVYYKGGISYKGAEAADRLDRCLSRRLIEASYDVNTPLYISNMAVLSKLNMGNQKAVFSDELLENTSFSNNSESWTKIGNISESNESGINVSSNRYLTQIIDVTGSRIYRYKVIASCEVKDTYFRMQVNWIDQDGKTIIADVFPRMCSKKSNVSVSEFVSPSSARRAAIYVIGTNEEKVYFENVSLKERISN